MLLSSFSLPNLVSFFKSLPKNPKIYPGRYDFFYFIFFFYSWLQHWKIPRFIKGNMQWLCPSAKQVHNPLRLNIVKGSVAYWLPFGFRRAWHSVFQRWMLLWCRSRTCGCAASSQRCGVESRRLRLAISIEKQQPRWSSEISASIQVFWRLHFLVKLLYANGSFLQKFVGLPF